MKQLIISELPIGNNDINSISEILDFKVSHYELKGSNWSDLFPTDVKVFFALSYFGRTLFLKFYIRNDDVRGIYTENGSPVWEDSCCEFFFGIDEKGYYNLEVNCLGAMLFGFGKDRKHRTFADNNTYQRIKILSSINKQSILQKNNSCDWNMLVVMDAESLFQHNIRNFKNLTMIANFYKCAGKSVKPHYLSWSPIVSDKPDFHLPEFFGEVVFI